LYSVLLQCPSNFSLFLTPAACAARDGAQSKQSAAGAR
jgi:hypothetical protein